VAGGLLICDERFVLPPVTWERYKKSSSEPVRFLISRRVPFSRALA
jgi:hypothetical protein